MTWEGSVQKLSHACDMELQEQLLLCTTVVPASHLVTWRWWGSRAFSREKKNQRWTAPHVGLRFLFPPHQPHCSPPFLVQLSFGRWETGGTSQLPAHQHYTKVLLCLRIPVDFPLFLSPSSTFLKIGQESVSSTTFSK